MVTMTFIEDLINLKKIGALNKELWTQDEMFIYLHFQEMFNIWVKDFYARNPNPVMITATSIRNILKSEPGFVQSRFVKRIDGKSIRCLVFRKSCTPTNIKKLVGKEKAVDHRKKDA